MDLAPCVKMCLMAKQLCQLNKKVGRQVEMRGWQVFLLKGFCPTSHIFLEEINIIMQPKKILHVFGWDKKFVPQFIDFIDKNFSHKNNKFIIYGEIDNDQIKKKPEILLLNNLLLNFSKISIELNRADKIIIHGLFVIDLIYILCFQPWVLKKCYWAIWGGDLYAHEAIKKGLRWHKNEFFRHLLIKRIGHLITYIKGDVDLARKWYGATGEYHECIMYPSNLYIEYDVPQKEHATINIQVGNSAGSSNNHLEAFEKLIPYKERDIKIFVPLSYGPQPYAKIVIKKGLELFGDKFIPLTEFMPFDKYLEYLGLIDIAIFNHNRQQAMGNMITLLGLGKTIYMRSDLSSSDFFSKSNINVFDVNELSLEILNKDIAHSNRLKIKDIFSNENLVLQFNNIFS